jgi:NTE family protein
MPPLRVQIAIQGGGAKICALLAAAEALQAMQGKEIEITRVGGTSAGSIVAALLASKVPLDEIRRRLRHTDRTRLLALFPNPNPLAMAVLAICKQPFWKERSLRKLLASEFKQWDVETFDDVKKKNGTELVIVATNLTTTQPMIHRDPGSPVVQALLDSCGLPFYLRVAAGANVVVDGGICENLPSHVLQDDIANYGPILAIGLKSRTRENPTNPLAFGLALLETAMNTAMLRAIELLGPSRVFQADTDVGTFGFAAAFDTGLGPEYDLIKRDAKDFFKNSVQAIAAVPDAQRRIGDPWATGDPDTMRKVFDVFRVQHAPIKIKCIRTSLEIVAHSLKQEGPMADEMTYRLEFDLAGEPISAHSVSIANPDTPLPAVDGRLLTERRWEIFDRNGTRINAIDLPAIDPDNPDDRRVVLFFDPILRTGDGVTPPFTLTFYDFTISMLPGLKVEGGEDWMMLTFDRATGEIGHGEIVAHVPREYMLQLSQYVARTAAEDFGPVANGRAMTAAELAKYPIHPGFEKYGWCGDQIALGHILATSILRRRAPRP